MADLGKRVSTLFAQERLDDARLVSSFVQDDDPTPTAERQSYTRIVGLRTDVPTEITAFDSAMEGEIGAQTGITLSRPDGEETDHGGGESSSGSV